MYSFDTFQSLVNEHAEADGKTLVMPVFKRLSADLLTPVSAFLTIRASESFPFLFESVEGGEKLARYSFLGKDPFLTIRSQDGRQLDVQQHRNTGPVVDFSDQASVYDALKHFLTAFREIKLPELPRFSSGGIGYLGYDTVRLIESLPDIPEDDLALPDAIWCFYDTVIAFDHVKHQLILIASAFIDADTDLGEAYEDALSRISALEGELADARFDQPAGIQLDGKGLHSNISRPDFEAAVEKAKEYIYNGDIFQVVLSRRFSLPFSGDQFNLYRALRQVNPSPYLFYLDFEQFALVGSSPEVLVRVEDGKAEVLPIAGTRPRGRTPEEDQLYETDLLADPKERAEHLMLVDLGRNDLGRVCQFQTVHVERYAYIERYSHVMHIVSSVAGQLQEERAPTDVLRACFPAGTVSGAPKVRAMEIIDELEPNKRGIYAGAVGYLDFSGNVDTCIAIRTMVVKDGVAFIQAGAGIVADSDPASEYEETENKARALRQALEMAAADLL